MRGLLRGSLNQREGYSLDAHTVELQPSLPEYPTLRAVEGTDELTIIGTFVAVWPTGRRD